MRSIVPYSRKLTEPGFYNPFHLMDEVERSFFRDRGIGEFKTDIRDAGDAYVLEADLPGFQKEDIDVDVDDESLTISAVRKNVWDERDDQGKYLRLERAYGSFSRSFRISGVRSEGIEARLSNGVLILRLPKAEKQTGQNRRLTIEE